MKNIDKVFRLLKKMYPERKFFSDIHTTPYKVLISTILSQRTRDENTLKASQALFRIADTPEKIIKLKPSTIEKAIKPSGFYRNKTKTIIKVSKQLLEKYKGVVPNKKEELLELEGVGPKTASCVLLFGYEIPKMPVDIHVFVISKRLGWSDEKTPESMELDLERKIPKKYWMDLNELLVRFGQDVCLTRNPRCNICKIRDYCYYLGKENI